jgi:hypothetical protein
VYTFSQVNVICWHVPVRCLISRPLIASHEKLTEIYKSINNFVKATFSNNPLSRNVTVSTCWARKLGAVNTERNYVSFTDEWVTQWHSINCCSYKPSNVDNWMQMSPFWEANSCSATQYISNIFWNLMVHYRVHNSLPLDLSLSQMSLIHPVPLL